MSVGIYQSLKPLSMIEMFGLRFVQSAFDVSLVWH
jgi:hypothetical protein